MLAEVLAGIVGADRVSADPAACALAGADLVRWAGQVAPDLVVRPADTAQVAAVVAAAARDGRAIVPRGAGLSYTGGVSARVPTIALDLTELRSIAVDSANLVAVVGAGCTWQALAEALAPHGLRAAMAGPISGSHSTIGGAVAQVVPGSMDAILGVTAVLADGTVVRTGSWALDGHPTFARHHGPDLTGLFIGDCGAFAVKTEIAIRLETIRPVAFESFAYAEPAPMLDAMAAMLRSGHATRAIAFDQVTAARATQAGLGETLRNGVAILRQSGSPLAFLRTLAGLRRAQADLTGAAWSLHVTIVSPTPEGAAAQARAVCAMAAPGTRIEAVVPKALHAKPYSIRGFVGPKGERWAPVHGIFAMAAAGAAMAALRAQLDTQRDEMVACGVRVNWLVSSSGGSVVIEPMFYWPDALDPIHLRYLSERNRARFGGFPENPAARDLVARLRSDMRAVMDAHGAVHGQIGRFYRLRDRLEPGAAALLQRVKAALDPERRMNPGVLGL